MALRPLIPNHKKMTCKICKTIVHREWMKNEYYDEAQEYCGPCFSKKE